NLGMEVIAEGVETEQELLYLSSKGCNVYQGYYFSRPVAIATFNKILALGNSNLPN
ncbi:MAG: EAL domain-containing protein, partial [Desulfobacterales bacterium]|nr:EAL domain-containing protein [Deltaproteobacteria bacterium]NNK95343.1 EAL domain-containing protein [Desulfobacterales bacterium]